HGAVRAVTGDAAPDESRISRRRFGIPEAEALDRARREIVDEDVGAIDEPLARAPVARLLEVEDDASLSAIQPREVGGHPVQRAIVRARGIAAIRPLDLDDVGAEVRELPRAERSRHRLLEGDDANSR